MKTMPEIKVKLTDDPVENIKIMAPLLNDTFKIVFPLYLPRKWFYSFLPETCKPA